MKLRDANLQVNDKNSFTHPPSYILHSFSKNTSRLLFPKSLCRSSRLDVFYEKGVLRIFAKFTRKQLRQSLFFSKVAGACNFIKKEALAQVFSCEFCEISKDAFFYRTPLVAASAFDSVRAQFLLGNISGLLVIYLFNYNSSKSTFYMLNVQLDVLLSTAFVKQIGTHSFLAM